MTLIGGGLLPQPIRQGFCLVYFNENDVKHKTLIKNASLGVVVNVLKCDIVGREFEFQLRYYVHFGTNTYRIGITPTTLARV